MVLYRPERTLILYELNEFKKFMTELNARPRPAKQKTLLSSANSCLVGWAKPYFTFKNFEYAKIESEYLFLMLENL